MIVDDWLFKAAASLSIVNYAVLMNNPKDLPNPGTLYIHQRVEFRFDTLDIREDLLSQALMCDVLLLSCDLKLALSLILLSCSIEYQFITILSAF